MTTNIAERLIEEGNAGYRTIYPRYYYYIEAIDHAGDDLNVISRAYIGLGNIGYTSMWIEKSHIWYLKAIDHLTIMDNTNVDRKLLAEAYIGLGNARHRDKGLTEVNWYLIAIDCARDGNHLLAKAYVGLGNAQYVDEMHKNNGLWYLDAIKIAGYDNNLLAQAYIGLGNANYTDKESTQSDWYLKAIEHARGDNNLSAQAYIGLGHARYTDNGCACFCDWYLKAIKLADHKLFREIDTYTNIKAQAYIALGNAGYTNDTTENAGQWYEMVLKSLGSNVPSDLRRSAETRLDNYRSITRNYSGIHAQIEFSLFGEKVLKPLQNKEYSHEYSLGVMNQAN